jgi:serine/threonine protein kinase
MSTDDVKVCPYCGEEIKTIAVKCRFCGSMLGDTTVTGQTWVISPDSIVRQALAEKYELLEAVGNGGMATVYKAVQKSLGRIVALKVIHQNLVHDQEFVKRFLREAQLAASLNHPNIVTVFDVGSLGQVHYMAMEFLEGEDLQQLTKKQGKLQTGDIVKWISPIAEALAYIHKKGLMHRDVKSPNIFITKSGRPVLTDFGIAFAADGTKLTQAGSIVGTPEYMSPEQANGKEFTPRSDLWSLGIVMYECLCGRVPFQGDNPLTTIHLVTQAQPPVITTLNPQVPRWIESIMLKLLAKEPTERFEDGLELAAALGEGKEVKIVKTEWKSKNKAKVSGQKQIISKNILLLAMIGIIGLITIITSVMLLTNNKPVPKQPVAVEQKTSKDSGLVTTNTSKPLIEKQDIVLANNEKAAMFEQTGDILAGQRKYREAILSYDSALVLFPRNTAVIDKKKQSVTNLQSQQDNNKNNTQTKILQEPDRQKEEVQQTVQKQNVQQEQGGFGKYNMVLVQGGTLQRGAAGEQIDPKDKKAIVYGVKVGSFHIGKYEVTQAQWEEVMDSNPSSVKGKDLPVESVTWNEVQRFISKINEQNNTNYRLPTEAEWEFAAKGGVRTKGYTYSGSNNIAEVGWILGTNVKPHPVGMKKPNELGLFDMTGNVDEWCSDWHTANNSSFRDDSKDSDSGSSQMIRGGSWNALAGCFRVASVNYKSSDNRIPNLGLRLAFTPK